MQQNEKKRAYYLAMVDISDMAKNIALEMKEMNQMAQELKRLAQELVQKKGTKWPKNQIDWPKNRRMH